MVKQKINNKEIYFDGYLKNNLDVAKAVIKKDWDMCFCVDGVEGTGKSVIAQQCGYYLDPTLNIERITFTPKEFKNAIIKAEKYTAVIYDEAYGGLASRQAMSQVNRTLVSMMAQIRQKNLFVFVVIPCFFELDKYIALWRSRALIHVYTGDNFERGYFSFFNSDRKKKLYVLGKKLYQYLITPNFRGRFYKGYVVNDEEYRQKKLKALEDDSVSFTIKTEKYMTQRNSLIRVLREKKWLHEEIAEAVNRYSGENILPGGIQKIVSKAIRKEANIRDDAEEDEDLQNDD